MLGKRDGYATSDSEAEDLPGSLATLPAHFGGRGKNTDVAVRLYEVGPRMSLKLIKIQEGLFKGNVVVHRLRSKTKEEVNQSKRELVLKREEKRKRKKE